jgi:transcriptional regulator with XRE-family HTH domain
MMGVAMKKIRYHNRYIYLLYQRKGEWKMDQIVIGKFIASKRRELNLTQEQLGEKLGVSHKSVSKWETGKCMPDYSAIEPLCQALNISISELLDGEENERENIRLYDDKQMLNMVERVQYLEKQNQTLMGIMVLIMGITLMSFSSRVDGTCFQNFISGVVFGVSIGVTLIGIFLTAKSLAK